MERVIQIQNNEPVSPEYLIQNPKAIAELQHNAIWKVQYPLRLVQGTLMLNQQPPGTSIYCGYVKDDWATGTTIDLIQCNAVGYPVGGYEEDGITEANAITDTVKLLYGGWTMAHSTKIAKGTMLYYMRSTDANGSGNYYYLIGSEPQTVLVNMQYETTAHELQAQSCDMFYMASGTVSDWYSIVDFVSCVVNE